MQTRSPLRASSIPLVAITAALLGLGCERSTTTPGSDAGHGCTATSECDDALPCTVDACAIGGVCTHTPLDELCTGAGEHCDAELGCTTTRTCATTLECDDAIACTVDVCGASGICEYTAIDARCTDEAAPVCAVGEGCVAGTTGCASTAECDDDVECTVDSCGVDGVCAHRAVDSLCDTSVGQRCASTGCVTPMPCATDDDCQDGDFCNGSERCIAEFGCMAATMTPRCDDSDACTVDTCDAALGCVYTCDSTSTSCGCSEGPSCTGSFAVTGAGAVTCALGMVNVDFTQLTFTTNRLGIVMVTPRTAHFSGGLTSAEGNCPDVDATRIISGGCEEHYRVTGSFTSEDTFEGGIEVGFVNSDGFSCGLGGCAARSYTITASRL